MTIKVAQAKPHHTSTIVEIYSICFPREKRCSDWITAGFNALPKTVYYHAKITNEIVGYAAWSVKNGFRDEVIIELDQVAVLPEFAGQGVGKALVRCSCLAFLDHIEQLGCRLKAIYITTREGNFAERLYSSLLGVERAATIENFGSGNEIILFGHMTSDDLRARLKM